MKIPSKKALIPKAVLHFIFGNSLGNIFLLCAHICYQKNLWNSAGEYSGHFRHVEIRQQVKSHRKALDWRHHQPAQALKSNIRSELCCHDITEFFSINLNPLRHFNSLKLSLVWVNVQITYTLHKVLVSKLPLKSIGVLWLSRPYKALQVWGWRADC